MLYGTLLQLDAGAIELICFLKGGCVMVLLQEVTSPDPAVLTDPACKSPKDLQGDTLIKLTRHGLPVVFDVVRTATSFSVFDVVGRIAGDELALSSVTASTTTSLSCIKVFREDRGGDVDEDAADLLWEPCCSENDVMILLSSLPAPTFKPAELVGTTLVLAMRFVLTMELIPDPPRRLPPNTLHFPLLVLSSSRSAQGINNLGCVNVTVNTAPQSAH